MRNSWIFNVLILVMLGLSGCIFEPREADRPSGTDEYPWVVPNIFTDALHNLTTGFASNVDSNYQRSLDEASFAFHPTVEDSLGFPAGTFDDWTKAVELDWLRTIKENYTGARTLRFGDENGVFTSKIEETKKVILEGEYQITLEPTPGATKVTYEGTARFTLVQGSQGWVMAQWQDIAAIGTNDTSSDLRGTWR